MTPANPVIAKGTPKPIIDKLQVAIASMLKQPDVQERMAKLGFEPVGSTPEEFRTQIRADTAKWSKVVNTANLKID